jgi:hypothetical protein
MANDINEKIKKIDKAAIQNLGFTEEEKRKNLAVIEAQYEMYQKTIKETEIQLRSKLDKNGNRVYSDEAVEAQLKLIRNEIDDTINKYDIYGGDIEALKSGAYKKNAMRNKSIIDAIKARKGADNGPITSQVKPVEQYVPSYNAYDPDAVYDIIPLPSNGECYASKMKKVSVAYLDARDENIIVSPNLYQDGKIFDVLLKRKVFNNQVDIDDMLDGDREAIILYLRASGFGNEYPIIATDKESGKQFNSVVDLNTIKYKEFKLVGDENGYFDYELPFSKKKIKFRFLTHRDTLQLEEVNAVNNRVGQKRKIDEIVETLTNFVNLDDTLSNERKAKVKTAINELELWSIGIDTNVSDDFNRSVTNRVEYEIMEVEGNQDRDFIHDFVEKMNIRDVTAFIKYVKENEPGLDYNTEIQKPESLGGGSMPVFLQLDQYVFLNTTL